jgi:hypothetical protein
MFFQPRYRHCQTTLLERPLQVLISDRAEKVLQSRQSPLTVELELYFSCLIRKQVRFHDKISRPPINGHSALNISGFSQLHIHFRPVMTRRCGTDYAGDEPPLTDFPIENPAPYAPHWLNIDYRNDKWFGEFGYKSAMTTGR